MGKNQLIMKITRHIGNMTYYLPFDDVIVDIFNIVGSVHVTSAI